MSFIMENYQLKEKKKNAKKKSFNYWQRVLIKLHFSNMIKTF